MRRARLIDGHHFVRRDDHHHQQEDHLRHEQLLEHRGQWVEADQEQDRDEQDRDDDDVNDEVEDSDEEDADVKEEDGKDLERHLDVDLAATHLESGRAR